MATVVPLDKQSDNAANVDTGTGWIDMDGSVVKCYVGGSDFAVLDRLLDKSILAG